MIGRQIKGGALLAKEAGVLEYWRKKYLGQAVIVIIAAIAVIAGVWLLGYQGVVLPVAAVVLVVAYLMCRSLKEEVQTRGEGLILAKSGELFPKLFFDVGRGLEERVLATQSMSDGYQVRECLNVMRGEGYILEEDWFYAVSAAKFLPVTRTVFQGVVFATAAKNLPESGSAELMNRQISGNLSTALRDSGAYMAILALMELFEAKDAEIVTADGALYVWIKTEKKLFYHFSLTEPNSPQAFVRRIEALDGAAMKFLSTLNG